jgi:hypothetical protein
MEVFINPSIARAIAHVTGKEVGEVQEQASIVSRDVRLVDFIEILTEPPCSNAGCNRPRSNYSDECFECRFEPFGSEWQREQEER